LPHEQEFAMNRLEHNRSGDWLNLRDDLNRFLGAGADDEINVRLSDSASISAEPDREGISGIAASEQEISAIQADVRQLLAWFAGFVPQQKNRRKLNRVPIQLEYRIVPVRIKEKGIAFSAAVVNGRLRDCVLGVLLHLLLMKPGAPVQSCPECGKLFVRQGKQVFCGRTCTNRAMINRKRARDRQKVRAGRMGKTARHKTK
jgi:hypothetical protein